MGKRLTIIWALSLLSALLLTGVQGYWLYRQYRYVMDALSEELVRKVGEAGEREYALREADTHVPHKFFFTRSAEYTDSGSFSRNYQMQITMDAAAADSVTNASVLHFNLPGYLSDDSLAMAVRQMIVNHHNPFRRERLDSILSALIPGIPYIIYDCRPADTSSLIVPYTYSLPEQKGVWVELRIPAQPVFRKMALHLGLSGGLILALGICLALQVNTILRQKKVGELRESFVNTMIHELKRPVQTLKTFVAFLGNKDLRADEATSGQVAQDAMFELDNLSAYLNKLKDMLHADSRATPLHIVSFNLEELTAKVVRLAPPAAGKEVSISTVCRLEPSPFVEADPVHIANILGNLIENAVKYSGREVSIEIKITRKGRDVLLTVSDNGVGILPNEREKVFGKFFRGSNLPDRQIPGLGLGLSYVKLITEAHGGSATITGHSGGGTSVQLLFPQ